VSARALIAGEPTAFVFEKADRWLGYVEVYSGELFLVARDLEVCSVNLAASEVFPGVGSIRLCALCADEGSRAGAVFEGMLCRLKASDLVSGWFKRLRGELLSFG
jgi:hypothetical protein